MHKKKIKKIFFIFFYFFISIFSSCKIFLLHFLYIVHEYTQTKQYTKTIYQRIKMQENY